MEQSFIESTHAESTHARSGLEATLAGLKQCNAAQCDMIANLEEYERSVLGVGIDLDAAPAGYGGGYVAELGYLHIRRQALESLIAAVEKYGEVAGGLGVERSPTEH
jgi:hypothetical protein